MGTKHRFKVDLLVIDIDIDRVNKPGILAWIYLTSVMGTTEILKVDLLVAQFGIRSGNDLPYPTSSGINTHAILSVWFYISGNLQPQSLTSECPVKAAKG